MEHLGGGVWGGVVAPLASVYAAFLAMLVAYRRSADRDRRRGEQQAARLRTLVRHLIATAAAGFAIFLLIVVVFSFMFAEEEDAIREALVDGSLLAVIALGALSILGWVEGMIRRPGHGRGARTS